jgi:hypothetical protein
MFILIYVDEIIITCSKAFAIDELLTLLQYEFSIKDLGSLNFFLGIEVVATAGGCLLSQNRYILDILLRTNMLASKPVSSPMATTASLAAFEVTSFDDPTLYISIMGALQYLCITRPDISFTANKLSQFMKKPIVIHWQSVKHLLCYIKQTIHFGLQFHKSSSTLLQAFTDADWAGTCDDKR